MIRYVIKKGKKYVYQTTLQDGYTTKIEKAYLYSTKKDAEAEIMYKNEKVVKVSVQITEVE